MKNGYILPNKEAARRRTKEESQVKRELFALSSDIKDLGIGKNYFIRTYGCQANFHDSEVIAGILEDMGFKSTDHLEEADVILLNTCAIRQNAEEKVLGELGNLKKLKRANPDLIIAMSGCMAQEEGMVKTILTKYPQVDLVFGTHNIYNLPKLLYQAMLAKEKTIEVFSKEGDIVESLPYKRDNRHKAWVNISYGCDKFCSYCIVPYTRGKERSRHMEDILDEVKELKEAGYKEVTLLGQNVNSYGLDLKMEHGFADLLEEVAKIGIPRVRFMTPYPSNFDDEAIEVCSHYKNIMPAIHLPLQSGSDKILFKMNRRYDSEAYRTVFDKIKTKIEGCAFTTDIIVGFPNESDEDFKKTLEMVDYCKYDNAYTFIYSKREGTPAAAIEDHIPMHIKEERLQILNAKIAHYANLNNQRFQDQIVEVLVDGASKRDKNVFSGYTPESKLVNFTGDCKVGEIRKVQITKAKSFSLDGKVIEE